MADKIAMEEGDVNPDAEMEDDAARNARTSAIGSLEEDEDINLTEEMLSDLIEELVCPFLSNCVKDLT